MLPTSYVMSVHRDMKVPDWYFWIAVPIYASFVLLIAIRAFTYPMLFYCVSYYYPNCHLYTKHILISCITDMKARTILLAHRRVMKMTFEPLKGNTDTRPEASINNQKNHHRRRLVITHPGASINIQYQVSPRNCITRPWASDIVKRKLVTKVSKGREVAKGRKQLLLRGGSQRLIL